MEVLGTDVRPGLALGSYELLVPIASGGMASIWAARVRGARGFRRVVAVKILVAELSDDANLEKMFLDEAANASRIRHPNVAEIVDLGEQDGLLYQVMEWIDGEPLHIILRECRDSLGMPIPLAVRIGIQACAGLHAAHELKDDGGAPLGLVHRDVSPQNILVGYDGVVKVVDFGVAKAATNTAETVIGQMKGKAPYMAPEQALSQPVDRRADVFALGIVLYQLTTGKHPYRGDNDLVTLRRICDRTPAVPPSMTVPGYPAALDAIVTKALAKERDARFATMEEMLLALEVALPPEKRGTDDDLAEFMHRKMDARSRARRETIHAALQDAEEPSASPSAKSPAGGGAASPSDRAPASIRVAPRAPRTPPPLPKRASKAPVSVRAAPEPPERRAARSEPPEDDPRRVAVSLAIFMTLVFAIGAATHWYLGVMADDASTTKPAERR